MKKPSEEGHYLIIGEYISVHECVIVCEQIACELLHIEVTTDKFGYIAVTIIILRKNVFLTLFQGNLQELLHFFQRILGAALRFYAESERSKSRDWDKNK